MVADTLLYKRLCPLIRQALSGLSLLLTVRPSSRSSVRLFVCLFVHLSMSTSRKVEKRALGGDRVGCPCPPVRNDNVTPRHFFFILCSVSLLYIIFSFPLSQSKEILRRRKYNQRNYSIKKKTNKKQVQKNKNKS